MPRATKPRRLNMARASVPKKYPLPPKKPVKVEPAEIALPEPSAASKQPVVLLNKRKPWKHPDELEYIRPVDWDEDKLIGYLCNHGFSIPPREPPNQSPWVKIVDRHGQTTVVPRGYRIPLMFAAKFQWESLKLVMTSATRDEEWDDYKFDILHVSRLCSKFLEEAREAMKNTGMDRSWRCATFDRVLTRYYRRWLVNREEFVRDFWIEYKEEEYEKDILKDDWARWVLKGHKGFHLKKDEIYNGITFEELTAGLSYIGGRLSWVNPSDLGESQINPQALESLKGVPLTGVYPPVGSDAVVSTVPPGSPDKTPMPSQLSTLDYTQHHIPDATTSSISSVALVVDPNTSTTNSEAQPSSGDRSLPIGDADKCEGASATSELTVSKPPENFRDVPGIIVEPTYQRSATTRDDDNSDKTPLATPQNGEFGDLAGGISGTISHSSVISTEEVNTSLDATQSASISIPYQNGSNATKDSQMDIEMENERPSPSTTKDMRSNILSPPMNDTTPMPINISSILQSLLPAGNPEIPIPQNKPNERPNVEDKTESGSQQDTSGYQQTKSLADAEMSAADSTAISPAHSGSLSQSQPLQQPSNKPNTQDVMRIWRDLSVFLHSRLIPTNATTENQNSTALQQVAPDPQPQDPSMVRQDSPMEFDDRSTTHTQLTPLPTAEAVPGVSASATSPVQANVVAPPSNMGISESMRVHDTVVSNEEPPCEPPTPVEPQTADVEMRDAEATRPGDKLEPLSFSHTNMSASSVSQHHGNSRTLQNGSASNQTPVVRKVISMFRETLEGLTEILDAVRHDEPIAGPSRHISSLSASVSMPSPSAPDSSIIGELLEEIKDLRHQMQENAQQKSDRDLEVLQLQLQIDVLRNQVASMNSQNQTFIEPPPRVQASPSSSFSSSVRRDPRDPSSYHSSHPLAHLLAPELPSTISRSSTLPPLGDFADTPSWSTPVSSVHPHHSSPIPTPCPKPTIDDIPLPIKSQRKHRMMKFPPSK